ncbi:hypothetical protein R5R35_004858 [Gryllus longicercus]|uniref:Core Histone H2A/H2B/H3 domain-containing protein n=1 Tax=Gryllus longicercus TaxID=2509291 RepID=A0AAN9VLS6_9ORTH
MVRRKSVSTVKKKITETNDHEIRDYGTERSNAHASNVISSGKELKSKENYAALSVIEESFQSYVEDLLMSENADVQEPIRTKKNDNELSAVENPKQEKKTKLSRELRVLQQIKKYQKSTELLIPRCAFARVCKDIFLQYGNSELRVARVALECLQEAAEMYLIECFQDAYLCAARDMRKTLMNKDLRLARGGRCGFKV